MAIQLNPYISFRDNAREAMEFYNSVFGGKLTLSTFKEFQASESPADDNKIMHGNLDGDGGVALMGADTPGGMEYQAGSNISMSLSGDDESAIRAIYQKLAAGGTVVEPLEKAPWGDTFGMLTDKFGINWMVNIAAPKG